MDKFTSKNGAAVNGDGDGGGEPGVRTKRTKIVTKTRTYMEGGYMKRVNEEVEVTDDEEVIVVELPPAFIIFACGFLFVLSLLGKNLPVQGGLALIYNFS